MRVRVGVQEGVRERVGVLLAVAVCVLVLVVVLVAVLVLELLLVADALAVAEQVMSLKGKRVSRQNISLPSGAKAAACVSSSRVAALFRILPSCP